VSAHFTRQSLTVCLNGSVWILPTITGPNVTASPKSAYAGDTKCSFQTTA